MHDAPATGAECAGITQLHQHATVQERDARCSRLPHLKLTAILRCCVSERPAVGAFISDTSMLRMRRPSR